MKGFYTITKLKDDKIVYCKSFDNLILSSGLADAWDNRIQHMSRIHIGNGTAVVNINQTTLDNELSNFAATNTKLLNPTNGKAGFVYTSSLSLGSFVGTIRELGVSRGVGNPLFSRVLLDEALTVYSDEQLSINYTVEFSLASVVTVTSDINSVSTEISIYPYYLIANTQVSSLPTYLKYQEGSTPGVVRPYIHTAAITTSDAPNSIATNNFVSASVTQLSALMQEILITVPAENTVTTIYGFSVSFNSSDLSTSSSVGHTISFDTPVIRTVGQIFSISYRWSLSNV